MQPLIAYIRVSTKEQGRSGLGLEAQQADVQRHAAAVGGKVVATYTEIESGKRADNRPQLQRALAHCRRSKATLVVGRLDRLARNVHFVSGLMESGVDFVACDNPTATKFTIHIYAAVAEQEARAISERTKSALAALKSRGVKLGSARRGFWSPQRRKAVRVQLVEARRRAVAVRHSNAVARITDLLPEMQKQRADGWTLQQVADALIAAGQSTSRGCRWTPCAVRAALHLAASPGNPPAPC